MFKNLKIGPRLGILFLIVAVIPLLASSIINYSYTKAELEKKTIDSLQAVVDSRASHINHSIQLRQEQAKGFAGAFLPRQLSGSGSNDPGVIQGIQADINSTFSDLTSVPAGYYKHIDKKTDVAVIGVLDVHGNIIANTDKSLIGKKMPLEYLHKVYKNRTYFRGFEKDPFTGKNFLIHLEEIRNWKTDEIVGAISLKVRAKSLNEITAARQGLGESGETYIVDKLYLMITQSRFVKDSVFNLRVLTEGTQACFRKEKAPTIYENYQGTEVLGVQKYLPDQDWCLVAEVDVKEAFAPVREFRNRTFFIGGFLILIISIFSYFGSRSFTRPILELHNAAQEVAKGNYAVELSDDSRDEIGALTKAFNDMARSLSKATLDLQEKSKVLFKHLAISTRQKKELKDVNEELDRFVYTASHDLRAPLRGIASFASFLDEDYSARLDEQGRDYINEIRKGATKMNAFIEDLLALSRISRIKNPYEDVSISRLMETVIDRIKFDIKENKVDLKLQDNMPSIRCDRIKMTEVFFNLISNAIKFSSKNNKVNPIINVGYVDGGQYHRFYVKDNGIGIDPKYHEQVFGIFKRLHTDKEYEGTGAGLSIIKRVIDDHQGKIWIESELGKGATFYFEIPKDLNEIVLDEEQGEA